jgi:hypothetical protein
VIYQKSCPTSRARIFWLGLSDRLSARQAESPGAFRASLRDRVVANPERTLELLPERQTFSEIERVWDDMADMTEQITVYDKIRQQYLNEIFSVDYLPKLPKLGALANKREISVVLFNKTYRMTEDGIVDKSGGKPSHSVSVALCKYLLLCPEDRPVESDWVSYRNFKDAAPFARAFANNVEKALAESFSGRIAELRHSCLKLGGYPPEVSLSYDLIMRFDALPMVPILLLFNDEDSEFPAQCSVLFERRANVYLDVESLAILGWLLAAYLQGTPEIAM